MKQRLGEYKPQDLANKAWAFATANHRDEKLIAALAVAVTRRLSELKSQNVASTAWAFATVIICDEKLFASWNPWC